MNHSDSSIHKSDIASSLMSVPEQMSGFSVNSDLNYAPFNFLRTKLLYDFIRLIWIIFAIGFWSFWRSPIHIHCTEKSGQGKWV